MSRLAAAFSRLQLAAGERPLVALLLVTLLFATATAGVSKLQLDLSFRPLFATGESVAEPTREFESVFGQSSGAWIAAIVENSGAPIPELLRVVASMSDEAGSIEHVVEVLSLTSSHIPHWSRNGLSLVEPLPDFLLEAGEEDELEMQFEGLLDGTRFVSWLVSADGSRLLVAARVGLPMDDLAGRREVVKEFRTKLGAEAGVNITLHFTGVSVVELHYEKQVLRDQLIATSVTSAVLVILLFISFGTVRAVVICLAPVSVAIPATLGLMGWLGQPVTIINTAIPAIVLVVGVADAVHMLTAWLEARGQSASKFDASRKMILVTGGACFFTTITTMGGFLSLLTADLDMVASFGLSAAVGIFVAWVSNQALLPILVRKLDAGRGLPDGFVNRYADEFVTRSLGLAVSRPGLVIIGASIFVIACAIIIPNLKVDQRFNEELPKDHEVSIAQNIIEDQFGGFLGPEISIRRRDGSSMLDDDSLQQLNEFVREVRALPETQHIWSIRDVLTGTTAIESRSRAVNEMRARPETHYRTKELINEEQNWLAVIVRLGDIGTAAAGDYEAKIQSFASDAWGPDYEVSIVGQWWLSQFGMRMLLNDMLVSLAAAMLIILPMLWLALRDRQLFVAAAVANILPLMLPLAFMALTGIVLRIGTAVVLAIALGIAVDNTLHIILRLRERIEDDGDVPTQIRRALRGTGRAVFFTTLALVCGFLSMMGNELLAIRDMGLVAAVAFTGAMLADLLVLPAVYAIQEKTVDT